MRLEWGFALVMIGTMAGAAVADTPAKPAGPAKWQPDAGMAARLSQHETVEGFAISLPANAHGQHQQMSMPNMIETNYVWTAGKDLTILAVITHQKDALPALPKALDNFESGTIATCIDPVMSKRETGVIDGLAAVRDRFTYTTSDSSHTKMSGFNYAVKISNTIIVAGAFTSDSAKAADLPLAEAAVLSFLTSVAKSQQDPTV